MTTVMSDIKRTIGRLTTRDGGYSTEDQTSLLFKNTFVRQGYDDISPENIAQFRDFIQKEKNLNVLKEQAGQSARVANASLVGPEITTKAISASGNTSGITSGGVTESIAGKAKKRDIQYFNRETLVFIDSKDRDRRAYPSPSDFKIYTGVTFTNVSKIELRSLIFPNVDQAINTQNNKVYWINQEDYDLGYPIYTASVLPGSYTIGSIATELDKRMNTPLIKRRNGDGDAHYFVYDISTDTDFFGFTNINAVKATSVKTVSGTGLIKVQQADHGYSDGDLIYITGVRGTVGGITSAQMNGSHTITVSNPNEFVFEVAQKSTEDGEGGGNTIRTGKAMKWQLLSGYADSVTNNLGFRPENSSMNIGEYRNSFFGGNNQTSASKVQNLFFDPYRVPFFMVDVDVVVTRVVSGVTSTIHGRYTLTGSLSIDTNVVPEVRTWSMVATRDATFGNPLVNFTISNDEDDQGQIKYTSSNYSGFKSIEFSWYGAFDGRRRESYENPTEVTFEVTDDPFESITLPITGVSTGNLTQLTIVDHGLVVGDYIYLYNVLLSPSVYDSRNHRGMVRVVEVPTTNLVKVDFKSSRIVSIDGAYAGTRLLKCTFPSHGFNQITSIVQSPSVNWVRITTIEPHNIDMSQGIYINGTNSVPLVDGYYEYSDTKLRIINQDTFDVYIGRSLTTSGYAGALGVDQKFTLYGATDFAGFTEIDLNGVEFFVRKVLDADTFMFSTQTGFSNRSTYGGGSDVRINSKLHGWAGTHNNSPNSVLYRPISLAGNDYSFICMPDIGKGMVNTAKVPNVMALAYLRTSAGYRTYDEFLSEGFVLDPPLNTLGEMHLRCTDPYGNLLNFNSLEWSCCLKITERIPE